MPEDFTPDLLKPYGVGGERRLSMHSITALNDCIGCGPGLGYPARVYGAPFNGLRALDPKPISTALTVIGVLIFAGIAITIAASGKKRKTA